MYYDWKRGERRASNTHKVGAKNSNFDLWKIKNELECTTIGRGQGEGFRHPESKVTNCHFEFHGVNSRFVLYTGTRVGPQANHVKDVMGHFRLFYAMFASLFD